MFFSLLIHYVLASECLSFKRSFPNKRIVRLKGVNTKKNIKLMTIGAIILPSISPSFIHTLLRGFSNSCFKKATAKKILDGIKNQALIELLDNKGQTAISKKRIKNKIPKLLSEDFFINYFLNL